MKLLRFDELPATPWKNGGGITRELACDPPGAGLDEFAWRVSIADIAQSGPFSNFPGVDRVIMLLAGDGMQLDVAQSGRHALTTAYVPYRFPGESPAHAELAGSASQDFNLMLRRELVDGTIHVWRTAHSITPDDAIVLFYCAAGAWKIGEQELHSHDTLVGPFTAADTRLLPLQGDGVLIGVQIHPKAAFNIGDRNGIE